MQYNNFDEWVEHFFKFPRDYIVSLSKTTTLDTKGIYSSIKFYKQSTPTLTSSIAIGDIIPDAAIIYKRDEWGLGKIKGGFCDMIDVNLVEDIISFIEDSEIGKSLEDIMNGY